MPVAVSLYAWVAAGPCEGRTLRFHSEQFREAVEFELDELEGPRRGHWSDYVRGVAAVLQRDGYQLKATNVMIDSDVPMGGGLGSSAALEVSVALALAATAGVEVPPLKLAKLCQRAEHEYPQVRCGIMDQFVSCFGSADHALMLDCRSLSYIHVPLSPRVRIVICNTMVKHQAAGGQYNTRRVSCEQAVEILRRRVPGVRALRDITLNELELNSATLGDVCYRRARHVVSENARVLETADALKNGQFARVGQLMYDSHHSLDIDYEVTCDELNIMVELARSLEGVYGARMTGGGFGGCTVNLVDALAVDEFRTKIAAAYHEKTGRQPVVYVCAAKT